MYVRTLLVISLLILTSGAKAQQQAVAPQSCTVKKVQVERLPDLNIPRSGGHMLVINDIPYVFGGHTSGFVPTPTAEYFENGEWHVLPMVYTHDHGLCQPLPSGKVLLAAGHEKALGIGQTFSVELFDPETRTFEGYGCMEKKRFFPSSALLADGRVLISGNSYEEDCMEVFDGSRQNKFVKAVSAFRTSPFIFPIASDDALVIGCMDGNMALNSDTVVVDRLKGDAPQMPLFNEWYPISVLLPKSAEASRISQDSCQYTYLLLVLNKKSQEAAIAKLEGTGKLRRSGPAEDQTVSPAQDLPVMRRCGMDEQIRRLRPGLRGGKVRPLEVEPREARNVFRFLPRLTVTVEKGKQLPVRGGKARRRDRGRAV